MGIFTQFPHTIPLIQKQPKSYQFSDMKVTLPTASFLYLVHQFKQYKRFKVYRKEKVKQIRLGTFHLFNTLLAHYLLLYSLSNIYYN